MKHRVVVLLITLGEKLRGEQENNCGSGKNSAERGHNPVLVRNLSYILLY
jgi:hypothetical protein